MSQGTQFLLILAILIPLWIKLNRDFLSGLAYAVVVLIACTHLLRIQTPGALPELSVHRLIIISLLAAWIGKSDRAVVLSRVPLFKHIGFWVVVALISLFASIDYLASTKRFLDFVLELFLLYFILATTLKNKEEALRVLRAAFIGIVIVGILAVHERYSGINVVDRFFGYSEDGGALKDIRATYRHRILLGAGVAMGFPLALYFSQYGASSFLRRFGWVSLVVLLAACYFSMSRGPWLAAVLAGGLILAFCTPLLRKRVLVLVGLAVVLLMARPGVYETLFGRMEDTLDLDTFKSGTFQYRLELWKVANSEVSKSLWRFLFGYGPGSGANLSLDWDLSFRQEGNQNIESWDNDLAYSLFQYGYVGLIATLLLYGTIPLYLISHALRHKDEDRDLAVCLAASAFVFLFMMSNVMIFTRQLYYLLWTLSASGFVIMSRQPAVEWNEVELIDENADEVPSFSHAGYQGASSNE